MVFLDVLDDVVYSIKGLDDQVTSFPYEILQKEHLKYYNSY